MLDSVSCATAKEALMGFNESDWKARSILSALGMHRVAAHDAFLFMVEETNFCIGEQPQ